MFILSSDDQQSKNDSLHKRSDGVSFHEVSIVHTFYILLELLVIMYYIWDKSITDKMRS